MSDRRKHLKALKADKAYRDAFMSEHVRAGIAFQIKAIREQLDMTQEEFGALIGTTQDAISSRYENPDYDTVSLRKLIEIAAAVGVGLVVRFVDYNKFLETYDDVSDSALRVTSIDELEGSETSSPPEISFIENMTQHINVAFKDLDIGIVGTGGGATWHVGQNLKAFFPTDYLRLLENLSAKDLQMYAPPTTDTYTRTIASSVRAPSISQLRSRRSGRMERAA